MAGQFTGLIYDNDVTNQRVKQSTGSLNYRLDPLAVNNCYPCYEPRGLPGSGNNYRVSDIIDTDTFLRQNNGNKYRSFTSYNPRNNSCDDLIPPEAFDSFDSNYERVQPKPRHMGLRDCPTDALESVSTRLMDPAFNIKGMGPKDMRFEYPLHDPQCNIFEDFQINTRLEAKDNHRAKWPKMIDQTPFFPVERKNRYKNCTVMVNCEQPYAEY